MKELVYICPMCDGDGKETCSNPDHGFIVAIGGELGRLGCPCCGHDEYHKIPNGGKCEVCDGMGKVTESMFERFCDNYEYNDEPKMA